MLKLFKRLSLVMIGLFLLIGCSPADLLNFTIPDSGYTLHANIAYGDNPRQKLDIYVPDTLAAGHPVLVFYYGGSWQTGNKNIYRFLGQAFATKGFITIVADYRLYPEISFPVFMEDTAAAFVWAHHHIASFGGNPANMFAIGHSAGAYNAVMLTLNDTYMEKAGGNPSWIVGTIGLAGPYDFLPLTDPKLIALFSPGGDGPATQPITYVHKGLPPFLLLQGTADQEVLPRNTIHLTAKLHEFDDPVTEIFYPDVAHIGIILSLAQGFRGKTSALEDITDFVTTYGKKTTTDATNNDRRN